MSAARYHLPERLGRMQRFALLIGVIGLVIGGLGAISSRAEFTNSYLFAFYFVVGIPLGGLGLTMLHHLTGGNWGLAIRRECEAAALTMPLMLLFIFPIALGTQHLFPWANASLVKGDKILELQSHYFNPRWFIVRGAIYFSVWIVLTALLCAEAMAYERTSDRRLVRRMRRVSAGGFILFMVTVTLASFDWVMSRESHFYSTMMGFMISVGMGLSAFVLVVSLLRILYDEPEMHDFLNGDVLHDLGNLMLTLVILWAYTSFAQLLIIWMGNIDHETPWYLHRGFSQEFSPWKIVAVGLLVFHFFVPFLVLLSRDAKRNLKTLSGMAAVLLVLRALDAYWLIAPSGPDLPPGRRHLTWMDIPLLVGMFGVWFAAFVATLRRRPLLAPVELTEEEVEEIARQAAEAAAHPLSPHSHGHSPAHKHGGAAGANPVA